MPAVSTSMRSRPFVMEAPTCPSSRISFSQILMETLAEVSGTGSSSAQLCCVKPGYLVVRTRSAFLPHGVMTALSY